MTLKEDLVQVDGSSLMPSVVGLVPDPRPGRRGVVQGVKAMSMAVGLPAVLNSPRPVRNSKRILGRTRTRDHALSADIKRFRMKATDDAEPRLILSRRPSLTLSPEQVAAAILSRLVSEVDGLLLGRPQARDACCSVITVPAHFSHAKRLATRTAAYIAGLSRDKGKVVILNEPTAAMIGYVARQQSSAAAGGSGERRPCGNGNYMVVDLGGGTLDVSIVNYEVAPNRF